MDAARLALVRASSILPGASASLLIRGAAAPRRLASVRAGGSPGPVCPLSEREDDLGVLGAGRHPKMKEGGSTMVRGKMRVSSLRI